MYWGIMYEKKKYISNDYIHCYNPDLKNYSREMRNNSTLGETKFWCELLRNKKSGYKFYRQRILLNYIVDFYCPELQLVVEIDGTSHDNKKVYDAKRENELNKLGLKVIRYKDLRIIYNFDLIEKDFEEQIKQRELERELLK